MAGLQKGATFKLRYTVTEGRYRRRLKPIMRGRHQRAVIEESRLLAGAGEAPLRPIRSRTYFGAAFPNDSMPSCSARRSGTCRVPFSQAARMSFISALPT